MAARLLLEAGLEFPTVKDSKMSENYLKRLAKVSHLRKSWLLMSDAKKGHRRETAGVDGRSINQFALRADEYLQNLRRKLLSHGGYSYSDLKAHAEPKDSGGHRVICIPTVADRIVQRAILEILSENKQYKFESKISYGFLKNRTVEGAVLKATELRNSYPWAYKTDISKFFDSIDRTRVSDLIRKRIRAPSIQGLITRATECEIKKRDSKQNQIIWNAGIRDGKGLRQGMPLSPYLSNLFLSEFDATVIKYGSNAIRYADDLIFLAKSKEECTQLHNFCENELQKIGLNIAPIGKGKTVVYEPSQAVEFLGISIAQKASVYCPLVSATKKNSMRQALKKLENFNYLLDEGISVSSLPNILNNKIAGWNASYNFCTNSTQISDFLESSRKSVITNIFVHGLGIELNKRKRKFLGI